MFTRYQKLKALITETFEIKIGSVLAYDLMLVAHRQYSFTTAHFLKPFLTFKLPNLNECENLVSIGRYGLRRDYFEIIDFVKAQLDGKIRHQFIDFNKLQFKFAFNPRFFWLSFKVVQKLPVTVKEKSYLFLNLVFYLNVYSSLKRADITLNKYVAFSGIHPLEGILTLFCKKNGVKTFSLQHGLYYIFKEPIPIDAVAYDNLISDYHISWGQYSIDEFTGYGIDASKLIAGGYPRPVEIKERRKFIDYKKIIVFLARKQFNTSNLEVIRVLNKYVKQSGNSTKIDLKLHPSLNLEYYSSVASERQMKILNDKETIAEILKNGDYDISIAVNTTAYYESYIYGIPCLRFKDDTFSLPEGVYNDIFYSMEDMKCLMEFFRKIEASDYGKKTSDRLHYILGIGLNNYAEIIAK